MEKKPQAKKQKKNKTEVERYVDRALNWAGLGGPRENYVETIKSYISFDDFPYEDGIDIDSVSKKMNEVSVYNAIKNSKHLKASVEKIVKQLATDLMETTIDAQKQIKQDKIYEDKQRKEQEIRAKKIAIANAKIAEKAAKLNEKKAKEQAQKDIFNECLTASQKKAFKKFYGIDINSK